MEVNSYLNGDSSRWTRYQSSLHIFHFSEAGCFGNTDKTPVCFIISIR